MAGKYDSVFDELDNRNEAESNPDQVDQPQLQEQTSGDPFDSVFDEMDKRKTTELKTRYKQFADTDPEESARIYQLSEKSKLPFDVVQRNKQELENRSKAEEIDFQAIHTENPGLSKFLESQKNIRIAQDEIQKLKELEDQFGKNSFFKSMKASTATGMASLDRSLVITPQLELAHKRLEELEALQDQGIKSWDDIGGSLEQRRYIHQMSEGVDRRAHLYAINAFLRADEAGKQEIVESARARLNELAGDVSRTFKVQEEASKDVSLGRAKFDQAEGFSEAFGAFLNNPFDVASSLSVESLYSTAPALAVSAITKTPVAIGAMGANSYVVETAESIYGKLGEMGFNPENPDDIVRALSDEEVMAEVKEYANKRGIPIALVDALSMKFAGKLVAKADSRGGRIAYGAIEALGVQPGMGGAGEALGGLVADGEIDGKAILAEMIGEVLPGTVEVITQAGGELRSNPAQKVSKNVDRAIEKALFEQDHLDQVIELAQEIQTSKRSPEAMDDLVKNIEEGHDVDGSVYIDAERFQELLQEGNIDQDNPAVQRIIEQLPDAVSSKSDVAVPLDDFMTHIAPSDFINDLRPHLTASAGGISQAEAEGIQPIRDKMIKDLQEKAKKTAESYDESERIMQEVSRQLVETGRMSQREADLNASIYPAYFTVKAQELDLSVEEVYEMAGVRIERGEVGDSELSQGSQKIVDLANQIYAEESEFSAESGWNDSDTLDIEKQLAEDNDLLHEEDGEYRPKIFTGEDVSIEGLSEGVFQYSELPENLKALVDEEVFFDDTVTSEDIEVEVRDLNPEFPEDALIQINPKMDALKDKILKSEVEAESVGSVTEALTHKNHRVRYRVFKAMLDEAGVDYDTPGNEASGSHYIYLNPESESPIKIRFSNHANQSVKHELADFNIHDGNKEEALEAIKVAIDSKRLNQAKVEGYEGNSPAEAKEWLEAKAKGLDLSHEARMERARQMGFDTENVWYRGVAGDLSEMQPNEKGVIWLTPESDYASDPHYGGKNEGAVYPVFVNNKTLFDYNNAENRDALLEKGKSPVYRSAINGGFRALQEPEIIDALKTLGFDGFKAVEPEGQLSFGLFDSSGIRSIHAVFDPDNVDSENILAQEAEVAGGAEGQKEFNESKDRIVEAFQDYYADQDTGRDNAEFYLDWINSIEEKGGDVYRVVFLESIDDLNISEPGLHWTSQDNIGRVQELMEMYEERNGQPYIIKATVEPGAVDLSNVDILGNVEEEEVGILPHKISSVTVTDSSGEIVSQVTNEVENYPQTSPVTISNEQAVFDDGVIDAEATEKNLPQTPDGFTRLYRASSPTVGFDDVFDAEKLPQFKPPEGVEGQFYTDDLAYADYFRETYGKDASIEYIDIPSDQASQFKNGDGSEYFVPTREQEPGGQPRAQKQTETEAFKEWFGDSKVVDENGEPLRVYHATSEDFNAFDPDKTMDGMFWFSSDKSAIDSGEVGASGSGRVVEAYVSIQNPAGWEQYDKLNIDQIIQEGYDGLILEDDGDLTVVAFEPTQIKSATDNRGTFDPNDPNILRQDQDLLDYEIELALDDLFQFNMVMEDQVDANQAITGAELDPDWQSKTKVAKNGKPIKIYRGGSSELNVNHFESGALGQKTGNPNASLGVWFTTHRGDASSYGEVSEFYLDIRNPKTFTTDTVPQFDSQEEATAFREELEAQGYDGIAMDYSDIGAGTHYVSFNPEQVIPLNDTLYQDSTEKNLFVAHNLSESNFHHAEKIGGLPAPSIAIGNIDKGTFDGFGEITLLAEPEFLNDGKVRAFDADIYSPRQPRAVYDPDIKAVRKINDEIHGATKEKFPELHFSLEGQKIEQDGIMAVEESKGLQLKYLLDNGVNIPRKTTPHKSDIHKKASKIINKESIGSLQEVVESESFMSLATQHYNGLIERVSSQEIKDDLRESFFDNGVLKPSQAYSFYDTASQGGKIDRFGIEMEISKKLRKGKHKEGFEKYAREVFDKVKGKELIFKGFTDAGNRRYSPYTIENLVKEMTKKLQSGEDFFYGAGSIRSRYAKEFDSIKDIQNSRDKISSAEDFEAIKEESNDKVMEALDKLKPYYKFDSDSFNYLNDAGSSIAEGRKGILEAFENDPKVFEITNELISYLTSLPTTYFEAKAQRAVDFSESHTAIVPRTASKETKEALKAKGLKVRVYSKNKEGDKERAMRGASKTLFFQSKPDSFVPPKDGQFKQGKKPGKRQARGSIQLLDNERIIRLSDSSDLSTFLHESAHLFLELEKRFAQEYGVTENQQAILDYLGVKSFDEITPTTKKGVEAHEKFARSFEAYLFEGKAPSKGLEKAFRSFKRWLTQIYSSIRSLNVRLTPEIRNAFDRMLATEAEIEAMHAQMQYSDLDADVAPDRKARANNGKESAKERLLKKLLAELTRQTKTWWKQDMKALTKKHLADMEAQQVYRTEAYIRGDKKLESDPDIDLRIDEQEAGEILGYKEPKIKRSKKPDPRYDSLLTFIAKSGGLSQQEAEAQGFDPDFWTGKNARTINQPAFGKRIFAKNNGMTFDEARELASESGYMQGEDTLNAFIDMVEAEVRGEPQYSMSADYDYLYGSEYDADSDIKHKPKRLYGLTKRGGMPAEEVATLMGYDSAYDMLIDLANSEPAETVARREAEIEMLRKHGDILNDGTLVDEAREAVHNVEQAKELLAELKALNKRNNRPHAIDRQALQAEAEKFISQLTVQKLTASVERFHRAEVKSAMAVKEAQLNNDAQAEIRARTQQLFNFYLYREARKQREKVEKQRQWAINARNKKYNPKKVAPTYINHIKRYLAVYDFRKSPSQFDKKRELLAVARWLKAQQDSPGEIAPQTVDPLLDRIIEADDAGDLDSVSLKGYKQLTIDEFQAVIDMAKHLQFVGGKLSEEAMFEDRVKHAKIAQSILDNAPRGKDYSDDSLIKKLVDGKTAYGSQMLWHADNQLTRLDGGEPGEMYNAVKRPIDEATTETLLPMMSEASEEMSAIYDNAYTKEEARSMNKKQAFDGYPPQSKWTIISMALNWGNEGNREALLGSMKGNQRLYTREQIETYLSSLDKKDWVFVQSVLDYVGKYRPMMGEVHRKIHGVTPKWVEAEPIYTKHGVFKGGYFPIKFDPGISIRPSEEEINDLMKQSDFGRFTKAHTKDGFTKSRVGSGGRPVLLDMSVFHSHVHNVIRYIALAEPVMEAQKVLSSQDVKTAMEETNNVEPMKALDVWLKDTASGEMVSSDIMTRALRRIRTGYTVSKLGWNVGTMLLQPLGILSAMPMVGYGHILKSALTVFTHPLGKNGMFGKSMAKSNFMKERASTFNKDIWDIVSNMKNPGKGTRLPDWVKQSFFGGIAFMQRFADTTVWMAEYNKGMKAGLSDKDAIYNADRMVRKTQASGIFSDRTPIERGSYSASQRQSEAVKLWTALGSYFFAKANMIAEITGKTDFKNPKQVGKYFIDFATMFMVETLIVSLIRGSWPEDEEDIPGHIIEETALAVVGVFPGLREAGSAYQGFTGGSSLGNVTGDLSRLAENIKDIPEDGLDKQFWKSLNNVGGVIFKYPSSATNRFGDALYREMEGEDVSPEEYLIYREKD